MRVDWGQEIRNVYVEVSAEPAEEIRECADVILEWVDVAGKRAEIWRKEMAIGLDHQHGRGRWPIAAGDWQLVGRKARGRQISCPVAGDYRLRAVVEYKDTRVKEVARTVYVEAEPPPPPIKRPIALSISAVNENFPEHKRIDHGEVLRLQINATNRESQRGAALFKRPE